MMRVKRGDCGNAAHDAVTFDKWCGFSGPTPRRISHIGLYLHPAKPDIWEYSSAGRASALQAGGRKEFTGSSPVTPTMSLEAIDGK